MARFVVVLAVMSLVVGLVLYVLAHVGMVLLCCGGAIGYAVWRRRTGG